MNKIKSFYIIKDEILHYVPLKKVLLIFKTNRRYRQLLNLYPSIYELYYNIQNDFEPYNEHIENEMLSYIIHFSRLQKHLSDKILIEFYFRFLLTQKKILADYDNIYFGPLLNYLNDKKYNGTLIVKLGEPKVDLSIRPNIEIRGKNIFLELYFNMKWIDREKQDNMDYIKSFLNEKIIGEETRKVVKKIQFAEYINLNEEQYEDFFFEQMSLFPNALFNLQSNYFDDSTYWKELNKFFKFKLIIEDKLETNIENKDNGKNKININIIKSKSSEISSNRINNSISKYYKEKRKKYLNNYENKNININTNNDKNENINKININDKEDEKISDANQLNKGNNNNIINDIKNNENKEKDNLNEDKKDINDNQINIINEENLEIEVQNKEVLNKINALNKNILSIRELDNVILDLRKNKINVIEKFINSYINYSEKTKNKLPSKISFINFTYDREKGYFSELNNKIDTLIIVQRIYRNTPYPFFISPKLNSLIALKLERINILEENLISIINNNPLLEIFEIHKNYTGYVFGYNLALALSQLFNLKSLITEFFWYKDYVPNFKTNSIINRQENEFFKFLTSTSLKYLSLANETNINIITLHNNLPNLISLSMEYSNIIEENNNDINDINNNENNCRFSNRFSIRKKFKRKLSSPLIEVNYIKDFNYTEKDRLFHRLRDLNIVKIQNCDEFFKKIAFFNKIENLYVDYFDTKFFETFAKYGHHLNNLDMLFVSPDFSEKIKPADSEKLVKILHYFKKLTYLQIGFYCINEELVNLLFNELTKLPLLQELEIRVDVSSEENKEILKNVIDQLKGKKYNSEYLTITYTFNDKRFRK